MSVKKRDVVRWLLDNGFTPLPGRATGHAHYDNGVVKVTIVAHGSSDLTKKHMGMVLRQLTRGGFDKNKVLADLGVRA